MKKIFILFYILLIIVLHQIVSATEFRSEVIMGYNGGVGFDITIAAFRLAPDFPLALRFNFGYTTFDPGNARAARKIFINNNEGGTIEEKGSMYRLGFDFLYPIRLLKFPESYFIIGPRYASFTGNFKFIGDNEDFDVTSKHWGLGIGVETDFRMNQKFTFILTGGADYYFASTLYGHDTSYSPDGQNNNPRENYQYSDADDAINQPKLKFRFMVGIGYRWGKK